MTDHDHDRRKADAASGWHPDCPEIGRVKREIRRWIARVEGES